MSRQMKAKLFKETTPQICIKLQMVLTFAAPVLLGMMLNEAALPPLQSFEEGPSTVFWVAGSRSEKA